MNENTVITHFVFVYSLILAHLYLLHAQPFVELNILGPC